MRVSRHSIHRSRSPHKRLCGEQKQATARHRHSLVLWEKKALNRQITAATSMGNPAAAAAATEDNIKMNALLCVSTYCYDIRTRMINGRQALLFAFVPPSLHPLKHTRFFQFIHSFRDGLDIPWQGPPAAIVISARFHLWRRRRRRRRRLRLAGFCVRVPNYTVGDLLCVCELVMSALLLYFHFYKSTAICCVFTHHWTCYETRNTGKEGKEINEFIDDEGIFLLYFPLQSLKMTYERKIEKGKGKISRAEIRIIL